MENKANTGSGDASYQVLARRWRPKQFEQLIGQEAIGVALRGAIEAGRVAHAYLFTGARGVGKTSTARIFAKALNCVSGPTCNPCDECDICRSIASGDDVDVLEIDGASNRGIDEIRELRQNVHYRPTRSRFKIYIIDEVHMLTREAFNALLKTLEEPPEHVKFIFATTDPLKIPITILSRCQRFDFRGISSERVKARLVEIVRSEEMEVDDEALEILARRSGGSMRDAQSLLDQLLAFGRDKLTADDVHRLLGTASEERLLGLATDLANKNVPSAIASVDEAESEGVQLGQLIDQLLDLYRDVLVVQCGGDSLRLRSVSERERPAIANIAGAGSAETLLATADILAETKIKMRGSEYGRVLVDIALVRIGHLEQLAPIAEILEMLGSDSKTAVPPAKKTAPGKTAPGKAAPRAKKKELETEPPAIEQPALAEPKSEQPEGLQQREPIPPTTHWEKPTPDRARHLLEQAAVDWNPIIQQSVVRSRVDVDPEGVIVVYLDSVYNSAERAAEIRNLLAEKLPGYALRVELEQTQRETANHESYSERLQKVTNDPLVQDAIEIFGAKVVRVEN